MNDIMADEKPKHGGGAVASLLAVVALGAGIAGIITAVNARKAIAALRSEIADHTAAAASAQEAIRALTTNSERAFSQAGQQLELLHNRVNMLANRIVALSAPPKPEAATLPPPGMAPPAAASAAAPATATAPAKSYTVEPGDNYSRIAKKLNVSVAALEKANPDVDPTKLKIGQTINVP